MTQINALVEKTSVALTDEFELQETGGGNSRKATLQNIQRALLDLSATQASTSGTEVEFTGIDSSARRVTVLLNGVSGSSTGDLRMTLNDESSGYLATLTEMGTSSVSTTASTAYFDLTATGAAASVYSGAITLVLEDETNHVWTMSGVLADTNANTQMVFSGLKDLTADLSTIQITVSAGAFDAGNIAIMVE